MKLVVSCTKERRGQVSTFDISLSVAYQKSRGEFFIRSVVDRLTLTVGGTR